MFLGGLFLVHTLEWSIMLVITNMHIGEDLIDTDKDYEIKMLFQIAQI